MKLIIFILFFSSVSFAIDNYATADKDGSYWLQKERCELLTSKKCGKFNALTDDIEVMVLVGDNFVVDPTLKAAKDTRVAAELAAAQTKATEDRTRAQELKAHIDEVQTNIDAIQVKLDAWQTATDNQKLNALKDTMQLLKATMQIEKKIIKQLLKDIK